MTRALPALVLLLSCARPTGVPEVLVPPPPELAPLPETVSVRSAVLRGEARDAVVVRLYVDDACAGPVWAEQTADTLVVGFGVELVPGENVFTARSVSASGGVSGCAAPVRTRLEVLGLPDAPSELWATPGWTAASLHFTVHGVAPEGTRVRLHGGDACDGPVVAELSPRAFFEQGFAIDLAPGTVQQWVNLDVVSSAELASACTRRLLVVDLQPPVLTLTWASPLPSSEPSAWVRVRGDFATATLFEGRDCAGAQLGSCQGGDCLLEVAPVSEQVLSAWAEDPLHNAGCVATLEGWSYDALASPAVRLRWAGPFARYLVLQVPTGRPRVAVFPSPDCTGVPLIAAATADVLLEHVSEVEPLPDGGAVSGRAFFPDGGEDLCSLPLLP